jgi:hypothetical protein
MNLEISTGLHGITSYMIVLVIIVAMRTNYLLGYDAV